jgi:hypothetical protein
MMRLSIYYNSPVQLLVAGLLAVCLATGCEPGNGQGLDENGNPISLDDGGDDGGGGGDDGGGGGDDGGGGGTSGNPNATLDWVQLNVFGGVCSLCHVGGAFFGVNWNSEEETCKNVYKESGENDELYEIEPFNPDRSYVIWKVEGQGPNGEAIEGVRMPASNPALSPETIQNIRDWIGDGAPGCEASA